MRDYIDAAAFKECILCADAALQAQIQAINDLNVFPVPDGDTGTNMGLTINNAAAELRKREKTWPPRRTAWPAPCSGAPGATPA